MDKTTKIKIADNTQNNNSEVPNFSLTYSAKKIHNSQLSYEILSKLKSDDNVFIEINSSLLSLNENDKKTFILQFVDSLEKIGIEFRKKKISVAAKRSFLSIGLESKKREGFELLAYIPHDVWCNQEFVKVIPEVGVRFYLLKSYFNLNIDAFFNLDEDEKLEQCRLVIFNNILLGSMGINTSMLKKDDILELLNK